VRDGELAQPPRAVDIHLEGLHEDFVGESVEVVVRDRGGPSGVVHQNVETTELRHRLIDQSLAVVLL